MATAKRRKKGDGGPVNVEAVEHGEPQGATRVQRADAAAAGGRGAEAEQLYREEIADIERERGREDPSLLAPLQGLQALLTRDDRASEATDLVLRRLEIARAGGRAPSPDDARELGELAELYRRQKRYGDAEAVLKRSRSILERTAGREHVEVGLTSRALAELQLEQGRPDRAAPDLRRALAILEKERGPSDPEVADLRARLAEIAPSRAKATAGEPTQGPPSATPGIRVQHAKFGPGVIVSKEGDIVTIRFDDGQTRRLSLAVAKLAIATRRGAA